MLGVLFVFDLLSLWAISVSCDIFSSIFLSTVKTLLSVSALFSLSLMGVPCISKFCLLPYCSKSLISNSREDILSSSNWFFHSYLKQGACTSLVTSVIFVSVIYPKWLYVLNWAQLLASLTPHFRDVVKRGLWRLKILSFNWEMLCLKSSRNLLFLFISSNLYFKSFCQTNFSFFSILMLYFSVLCIWEFSVVFSCMCV